nr:MAG TPA: hypothetical protein [Caudoviricetes sp.]
MMSNYYIIDNAKLNVKVLKDFSNTLIRKS